jgi:hypothetical protein
MEPLIPIVVLVGLGVPFAVAVWLIVRAVSAQGSLEELSRRLQKVEFELSHLNQAKGKESPGPAATMPIVPPAPQPDLASPAPAVTPPPIVLARPAPSPAHALTAALTPVSNTAPSAPSLSRPATVPVPPLPAPAPKPAIDWEQFLGVKGFAWAGGFALFLGVAFFIKYAFDNNLVPPELRMAVGFLTGLGLLLWGVGLSRKAFLVLAHTLCATGVVILYAVTFACRSVYHFEFFGLVPTFLLMVLITLTAFFVAVRLDALVVAVLGMLGGLLTPVLLSTGQDNPAGLFGYLAILDAGLVFVALNRRWHFLVAAAALGTALLQLGWLGEFFEPEKYFSDNKICVALGVLLGFIGLFLAAAAQAKRRGQTNPWFSGAALGLAAVTLACTAWFLGFTPLAQRPWLMFSFVFLVDLAALGLTLLDRKMAGAQAVAGFAVFTLLGWWTGRSLANELLNAALVFYFSFAVLHAALPVALRRRRLTAPPAWADHFFPILALVLVLLPVWQFPEVSFIVWPFILLVDVLAIALAVVTATMLPVLAVLLLTLAATGLLIFKIPADLTGLPVSFFLLGAFAVFFVSVGGWLVKHFHPEVADTGLPLGDDLAAPDEMAAILPVGSTLLPFLLLIMAVLRLPLLNPSPVFGLALLLVVLLLGVTRMFALDWFPAVGLAGVVGLECAWHLNHFDPANTGQPLGLVLAWYLIFYAAFAVFPFVFLRRHADRVAPWAVAALAAVPQFFLIHRWVAAVHPNGYMGMLPAAFALPGLLSLVVILKKVPAAVPSRLGQIVWFGGVALFFITLIFPVQFERQWLTLGWALEGAALLWLFHRVPHPGLRLAGVALLAAAFVRLALNPAVLEYHPRAATPIFNWYLYAYGLVTLCLFAGAKLLAPPRHQAFEFNVPPLLAGLGTTLAFLLVNLEVADYFSQPGDTLTFQFSEGFARDMAFSIAWALFALILLVYGIVKNSRAARYTAMGLLCLTLLKLFLHDLAQLDALHRIGAFVGVAVVAMLASYAYQKFFNAGRKEKRV